MPTFINSRAMAMTLALQTMDDQVNPPPRARRRVRRARHADGARRRLHGQ